MAAIPLKSEYGPTLGQILSPRWRASGPTLRAAAIAAGVALVGLLLAGTLALLPARVSYGGPVPFSFSYRGLYRTRPDPGGYVKVQDRVGGRLRDSFAVQPLTLPRYVGGLSGELPLYASGYIRALRARYRGFVLEGEGKARVNEVAAYTIYYTALVEGRKMYGRDVLLLGEKAGVRAGVDIVMLTAPSANAEVTSPLLVGTAGPLYKPLRSFTLR